MVILEDFILVLVLVLVNGIGPPDSNQSDGAPFRERYLHPLLAG
jgi:hypothetical protein